MLLMTGEAEFAVKSAEITPVAHGQSIDLLTVQALNVGLPFQMILRSDEARLRQIDGRLGLAEKLARIQGLSFATTSRGGASAIYTHYLLHAHGFDPRNHIRTFYLGDPQTRKAAFRSGQAQLTTAGAENREYLESGEAVLLVDLLREFPPFSGIPFLALHTRRSFAERSPETVAGVIRALARAIEFLRREPGPSGRLLAGLFADRYDRDGMALFLREQVLPVLPEQPRMNRHQWDQLVEVAAAVGILEGEVDTSEGVMWTNRFSPPGPPGVP